MEQKNFEHVMIDSRYETFTCLFTNIARCIRKIKSAQMQALGLRGTQVQCIYFLAGKAEGMTLIDLCKYCEEDKGALSRTIKSLKERGLIFRDDSDGKKYKNLYKLTPKGQEAGEIITNKIVEMFSIACKDIKLPERIKFYEVLQKISDNLDNICKDLKVNHD